MEESIIWKLIDTYFQDNPQALVRHHIDSYNQFFEKEFSQILKEMNPLKLDVDYDHNLQEFRSKCYMYIGGKDGTRVDYGKPTIHDANNNHYMYPNECRLRNMSYAVTVHYDVEIEYTRILRDNEAPTKLDNGYAVFDMFDDEKDESETKEDNPLKKNYTPSEFASLREDVNANMLGNKQTVKMLLEKIYMGKFPIMLQSNMCILHKMPREMRFSLGECKNDIGGYFIIDGKEKTVVPQEEFGANMINVYQSTDDKYLYGVDIKSVSENVSKPVRTLSVKIIAPTKTIQNKNIGVIIPNAGYKPIPLFIVFRALGILSDKEIITFCMLHNPTHVNSMFMPYLESSIYDASAIITQYEAIEYISLLVKGR